MSITVGPISVRIGAPPQLVYQMLSAIGQGDERDGERAEVLQRNGDELVCDFWTSVSLPVGVDRLVRTRERVTLRPPNAVEYEHLDGPVRGLRETITVGPDPDGGTRLSYVGSYEPRGLVDSLRASLLARPVIRRVIRQHFDDVRLRAEARAARSRIFPGQASVSPRR
jgi:carbon monoxide dehydrogenase subunit G